mgnify:CR=1 FL=1
MQKGQKEAPTASRGSSPEHSVPCLNLHDQAIDPLQHFSVAALPVEDVLPGFEGKNQAHRLRI